MRFTAETFGDVTADRINSVFRLALMSEVANELPAASQLERFDADLIGKLLSKVSEEDRSLIMLKEVEGHSVEELAQMTGMNENTIKVKLFRTRQKLLKAAQRLGRGRVAVK